MVFSLAGGELRDATYTSTTVVVPAETLSEVTNTTAVSFASVDLRNVVCTVSNFTNQTGGELINAGNYTVDGCSVISIDAGAYNGTDWNVSYSYVYDNDNQATNVMNDTTTNISSVTDWFNIFIVIAAMVVLILLTVIIITAIRGSGLMGAKSSSDRGGSGFA